MYEAFIFDLDGVLVNTAEIQVISLLNAIKSITGFNISKKSDRDIAQSTITTKDKLIKFSNKGYFGLDQIEKIYSRKKKNANRMMASLVPADYFNKIEMFEYLKSKNKKIAIVTNANGGSTQLLLDHLGFTSYLDVLITNNDVTNTKPHPEPYIRALIKLGCALEECIIFEDSTVGLEAARATGATVHYVNDVGNVNTQLVKELDESYNVRNLRTIL